MKFIDNILKYSLIEHFIFAVLAILSVVFFEERLIADSSYYIFRVINSQSFWIEHNRYILAFSQFLPLIGVKLGFSLKTILLLYSIGHPIFFYIIFLIAKYYYKDQNAGFLIITLQTIGILSGFFVPMFELYYASALIVLVSTILYKSNSKYDNIIIVILSFFIITGHPFANILLLFVMLIHAQQYGLKYFRKYILILTIMLIVFIFKKLNYSEYEYWKTMEFIHNILHSVYDLSYFKSLIILLITYYKELLLIELLTLVYLISSKEYLKSAIVFSAFIAVLIIINLSYYGAAHGRYQEQVYFSLSFIVAYPFFIYLFNNKAKSNKSLFVLILFITTLRLYGIKSEGKSFSNRVSEIKTNIQIARKNDGTKFIINEHNLKYDPNWSYPIETLLISSYNNNLSITICTDVDIDFENNKAKIKAKQYLFRRWEIYDIESLNKQYFMLDKSLYCEIKPAKIK